MKVVKLDIKIDADRAIVWLDSNLYLLDQRVLPSVEQFIALSNAQETANAIREMVVRGAPAIGVTAAFGVVLAARETYAKHSSNWKLQIQPLLKLLAESRPTAVNLFWAINKMEMLIDQLDDTDPAFALTELALQIHQDDIVANKKMGEFGASLIDDKCDVITHCNAGALATGGYGTALGVIRSAYAQDKIAQVYADETRPWLQGSRLTAWELSRDAIPVTLLADGAAASLMASGNIGWIIVGSDRIAGNGDVANKIGTFHLILAAKYHGIKVMVAAPTSTIDASLVSGNDIPIEERDSEELLSCGGKRIAAKGVKAWNPVFDVTPAKLIDVIVTEKGIIHQPNAEKIKLHLSESLKTS